MPRPLDDELAALRTLLYQMADLVEEQLADAVNAFVMNDTELATQIIGRDDELDALEMEVDHFCERVFARFQPVASDLRLLIAAIKINTDLERMGDHCKNLAKSTLHLGSLRGLLGRTRVEDMADTSRAMLREVRTALQQGDRLLARKVLAHDQHMDRLYKDNFRILVELVREYPDQGEALAHLITAGKSLERLSDHAKNIARNVVFLVEGIDIRHARLRLSGG